MHPCSAAQPESLETATRCCAFGGDSDVYIVRGLIALLSGRPAPEIIELGTALQ